MGVTTIELGCAEYGRSGAFEKWAGAYGKRCGMRVRLIRVSGFALGLQMMIGLPGETWASCQETAVKIAALKPDCVRLYPALVVEGTDLARWYRQGSYVPLTVEQAADSAAWLLRFFEDRKITVIRIGLHAEKSLEKSCIAGPIHPAFGEMVYSRTWRNRLLDRLEKSGSKEKVWKYSSDRKCFPRLWDKAGEYPLAAAMGYEVEILPDALYAGRGSFLDKMEVKHCI